MVPWPVYIVYNIFSLNIFSTYIITSTSALSRTNHRKEGLSRPVYESSALPNYSNLKPEH